MKRLPFGTLFFCVFLPPVLYIFTIQGLETFFQKTWTTELNNKLISKPNELLEGHIHIREEIEKNIRNFFSHKLAVKFGTVPRVVVRTKTGRLLYPKISYNNDSFEANTYFDHPPSAMDTLQVGKENLKIMREGITFSLSTTIPRNTWLANFVLIFYILVFSLILYRAYRNKADQAEKLALKQQQDLEITQGKLTEAQNRLQQISNKEEQYKHKIKNLQQELEKADNQLQITEQEAIQELENLENKLQNSISEREKKEKELEKLFQEMKELEETQKTAAKKASKPTQNMIKRFNTLYKNLEFHNRAVEGFLQLPEDMQLKAEESIHNLNEKIDNLKIKRKVFSKKDSLPTFESEFGYKGRIYWRRTTNGKTQILAIGTKNTQSKDLTYLENLSKQM